MATELAKAFVQIVPSAQGIKGSITQALGNEANTAGTGAGKAFGSKLVGAVMGVVSTAAIGQALASTITEGAALEQSIGGIETLFKESADVVKANAAEAYRTAGMSANQYMELTTSFAASLLQSLGGNTEEAARISDMAMTDMSDNANKMGTDMERITDAYQGFAKQNYTMLDNLKLGYGGTKEEMQRLLADAQKVTGVEYDISSLADVYEAIHVIQGELDITGTTAKEASSTLSGSLASMKAAFKNVLGQLTLGQDVGPALSALAETTTTFLVKNLLPAVGNILKALPGALATFLREAVPQMSAALLELFPQLQTGFSEALPQLAATARGLIVSLAWQIYDAAPMLISQGGALMTQLAAGLSQALPELLLAASVAIGALLQAFIDNYPQYLNMGAQILGTLINGIGQRIPEMLVVAARVILNLVSGLIQNLPQIIAAGFNLITTMITGIGNALPGVIQAAGQIASMIWETVQEVDWLQLGKDIIQGMINGIGAMAGALWDAATNIARSALDAIKSFFGIASPSRLMRDEVGRWIPAGVAVGIESNSKPLTKSLKAMADNTLAQLQATLGANARALQPHGRVSAEEQPSRQTIQNIYFEQPMQAPDEIARALRIQNTYGLAGAR